VQAAFKGVVFKANARPPAVFEASCSVGGVSTFLGRFCTAKEAARAYDRAVRKVGRIVVNLPRPGTDEVQAVKGEMDAVTLARHAAVQQAAGGAGAANTVTPPSTASQPSKRRAAAPPPSEPPLKLATAPSIKSESPAAAAPEAPAAPPPPYKRRPPHRIGTAASPPPDDGPGLNAPASGIKTESSAAVKPEASATQPPPQYKRRPPHRIERESSLPPGFVAPAAGVKLETPVAPPHVPYTASTGRPLQAAFAAAQVALAASPPADDGPSGYAPTTGIKTETPAAVKAETPAAPPMPAVAASAPSASAAARRR
jgi:hypothetical protein